VRFFIDEDLSPKLAEECREAGYDAISVRDRGMLRASDREVSRLCFEEDRVLVTNNATDFLKLAEEAGLHPGLVFLPLGSRNEMRSWMREAIKAIDDLAAETGQSPATLMINHVLEVGEGGERQLFEHPPL
jgi:predicted nuclease of predicted toxin-antitoxin system